jgi:hypothetical protein
MFNTFTFSTVDTYNKFRTALSLKFNILLPDVTLDEHIGKVKGGYRLYSKHGSKNLGTFPTKAAAEKHEREVQYFKHKK